MSGEVTLSGSDFLSCFNKRRVLSPLPMFSHLREYLFKATKTALKNKPTRKPPLPKAETWCDRSLLVTPAYTALQTKMRASWRLPEKVKSHELKFHQ